VAGGTECLLLPVGEDTLRAFVRTEAMPHHMELWDSRAPFASWERSAVIPRIIQAPHVEVVAGEHYLLGRETLAYGKMPGPRKPGLCRTKIWRLRGTEVEEVLELPSLGDTSYVGTAVRPDGLLLVSYYSQHEREVDGPVEARGGNDKPADVFVAGIEC
jgi:hypothetical protein